MKQTFKFLTLSTVFNDCRDSVGRLSTLFLLLFALLGFTTNAWAERWTSKCNIYYYSSNGAGSTHNDWYNNDGISIDPNDATIDIGTVTSFYLKRSWALTKNNDNWGTTNMKWKYGIGSSNNEYNLGSDWGWCCGNEDRTFMFGENSDLIDYNVIENAPNNPGQNTLYVYYILNYNATDGGSRTSKTLYVNFTIPGFSTSSTSQTDYSTALNGDGQSKTISFTKHYGNALNTGNCELSGTDASDFEVTGISETGVTVKFLPSTTGTKNATLTITDAHGKKCSITLMGEAQDPLSTGVTLRGTFNSWSTTANEFRRAAAGATTATTTITFANAKQSERFLVYVDGEKYGNSGTILSSTNSAWGFDQGGADCYFNTAGAGTYTFTWDITNKKLSVTYPEETHPSSNYVYFLDDNSWGKASAHLYDTGDDDKITNWPGQPLRTVTIDGKTYYLCAPGAKTQIIFTNGNTSSLKRLPQDGKTLSPSAGLAKYHNSKAGGTTTTWKDFEFTLTLDKNGGEADGSARVKWMATAAVSSKLDNTPIKTGYKISKFTEDQAGTKQVLTAGGSSLTASTAYTDENKKWIYPQSVTLYTQWTANDYVVTLDYNNGSSTTVQKNVTYDSNKNLTQVTSNPLPAKTGQDFTGYWTNNDGTGTQLVGSDGKFLDEVPGYIKATKLWGYADNLTIYAGWANHAYTITYKDQGDKAFSGDWGATEHPTTHTYNTVTTLVDAPNKTGYTFGGWYSEATCENKVTELGATAYTADITLYAKWIPTTTTITIDRQDGSATKEIVATYDGNISAVTGLADADYQRTGYTFNGMRVGTDKNSAQVIIRNNDAWAFQSNAGTGTYTNSANPPVWKYTLSTLTLYTRWDANNYTITFNQHEPTTAGDESKEVTFDASVSDISVPAKTGLIFSGYWTGEGGTGVEVFGADGKIIANASGYTSNGKWIYADNLTLHAYWATPANQVVNFGITNGSAISNTLGTITAKVDDVAINSGDKVASGSQVIFEYSPASGTVITGINGTKLQNWYDGVDVSSATSYSITQNKCTLTVSASTVNAYAHAQALEYTVATAVNPIGKGEVTSNNDFRCGPNLNTTLTAINPTGYDFVNWTADGESGKVQFTGATTVSPIQVAVKEAGRTVTANFAIHNYTITYNLDGGTNYDGAPTTYTIETPTITLGTPTKTGYNFAGWTLNDNSITEIALGTTGNLTLVANWTAKTTNITLYRNGENDNTTALTAVYDGDINSVTGLTSDIYTRTGYTHKGIFAARSGGSYLFKYDDNGAAWKFNNSTQTGYCTATYWKYEAGGDLNLYSQWTAKTYTITFKPNGGSSAETSKQATYDSRNNIATCDKPTRDNYNFAGYYLNAEGTGDPLYNAECALQSNVDGYTDASGNWIHDGNVDVYAKWASAGNYVVTLTAGNDATTPGTTSVNVQINTTTGLTANITCPTKTGYTFAGYFTEASGNGSQLISANGSWISNVESYIDSDGNWIYNGNVELKAKWIANQTVVTFDKKGGTSGTNQRTLTYNSTTNLNVIPISKIGYTFGGYFTGENGTGTQLVDENGAWIAGVAGYTSNDSPIKWIKTTTAPLTLYAKWTAITYTITYNLDGGTNFQDAPATYNIETATINLGTPTKTNYTFLGWFDNSGLTGDAVTTIPTGSTGNKEYWAKWEETKYAVALVGAQSPESPVQVGNVTDVQIVANTPTPGYYFVNWTKTGSVTIADANSATTTIKATGEGTVTANFAERFYLRGSENATNDPLKGMPGWGDEAKTDGLFSSIDGNTATITMTLEASSEYKLKLGDLADGSSWGGDHEFKSGEDLWKFACNEKEGCSAPTFTTAIAGTYTFTIDFSEASPKMKITYPDVPDYTLTVAKSRVFGENTMQNFISGDGTEESPYQFYLDEEMTLTATALAEIEGVTAYYKFGEDAESSETLTKTIKTSSLDVQSIDVKAYYKANIGSYKSAEKSETIYYQGVAVPALHLHSSLTNDEVEQSLAPDKVTIYYTTDNYSDAAAITKNNETWESVASGSQWQKEETLESTIHSDTYVATATPYERTFTASLAVSVYKYVQVKVKDANPKWAKNVYMWNSVSGKKNAEWPGEALSTQLGDWYIFTVKYPTYDYFVINDGAAIGKQTIDLTIPAENICYEIGAEQSETDGKHIYDCTLGECPNGLYVGEITDVEMYNGESATASPVVQLDPTLNENNLQIAFSYSNSGIVTATQSGTKIMLSAIKAGSTTVTATYSIEGAENVVKTFNVTVKGAVMIQAKYSESGLGWGGADMHIHYWGTDIDKTIDLTWKGKVGEISQVYARIPLDKNNQINFQIYAWNMNENWHVTEDVTNVTASGCYTIGVGSGKRSITCDGDNCWAEYQVKIVMNNGTVYTSNTISDTEGTLSFFAPGENATGYNRGDVYLMCNGSQAAVISASTFETSGVYTAKTNGSTLTDVALYTGDYYIRTDSASGGWNDYKNPEKDNKFTTFDKIETSTYDRYWVKNIKPAKEGDKVNLQACVGNDYNENLANKIVESNYTDGNGDVTPDASGVNLRFGYDPATNNFERAIIKGSATDEFLNVIGDNVYKEKACSTALNAQNADSKFEDKEQWIYEKTVYVKIDATHISANAKLQSKAYNNQVMYQLGYEIDPITGHETATPKTFGLIAAGTTNGTYAIKLVYDFKTNRMVSGWSPSEDPIEGTIVLGADMLLVRNHQNSAAQIKFANNSSAIQQIHHIYGVMQIEKEKILDPEILTYEKHLYWISFPFDVKVSSIFGVGTYGVEWKLQRYDGAERASKGWFKGDGTTTFWKDMTIDDTMNAFEGYILSLKPSAFDNEDCPVWSNDRTVATFYFPSVDGNVGIINRDTYEQTVLPHECKIDREFEVDSKKQNHKITDSHWNVIGIPTFEDANVSTQEELQDFKSYYAWDASANTYSAGIVSGTLFNAMHAYMVQFCGKIIWTDVSVILKAKAPYTYTDDKNYTIELFFNGNDAEDHTYINLADGAHADFELNEDMMKIDNAGFPNIYSFAGNYNVAYNETEMIDQVVTIGVSAPKDGSYTFAMPKDFSGTAQLYDMEEGTITDLNVANYSVDLNKGTYNNRFQLMLKVEASTPTSIETNGQKGRETDGKTQKLLINDQIYLINGGRVYNATGTEVR